MAHAVAQMLPGAKNFVGPLKHHRQVAPPGLLTSAHHYHEGEKAAAASVVACSPMNDLHRSRDSGLRSPNRFVKYGFLSRSLGGLD
jgi:hypothetical protein